MVHVAEVSGVRSLYQTLYYTFRMSVTALWDEWNFTLALMRVFWFLGAFLFSAAIALVLGRGYGPIRRTYSSLLQRLSYIFFAAGFCAIPLFHLVYRESLSRSGEELVLRYNLLSLVAAVVLALLACCGHPWRKRCSSLARDRLALVGLGVLFLCLTGLEWLDMWDIAYDLGSWELEVRSGILASRWIALVVATVSFGGALVKGRKSQWVRIVMMVLILIWMAAVLWSALSSTVVAAARNKAKISPQVPAVGVTSSFLLLVANMVLFASVTSKLWVALAATRWNEAHLPTA